MHQFLSSGASRQLLASLSQSGYPLAYDREKHRLLLPEAMATPPVQFRLPLLLPPPANDRLASESAPLRYVILLVQSGSCAMGYFEGGVNLDHKVFRAYMVRKKQGKSQLKHLKTKGKSRAGSRVRLGETVEFFENINERLQQYFSEHEVDRIALSCSKTLIPYLFTSKVATPFDKRDERIYKIPRHVHTPIYEELLEVHKFLLKGELVYEAAQQPIIDSLLLKAGLRTNEWGGLSPER
jgi:hypothetical protein